MDVHTSFAEDRRQNETTFEWIRSLVSTRADRLIAAGLVLIVAVLGAVRMAPSVR